MTARPAQKPSFAQLFTPKLITVLREGYGLKELRADVVAGLTVAIVAIPLSMAIAIASGAKPEQGLYTAIVGGFLISALGGSRFQIGGPAGAFIVLVAATISEHGYEGFLLATIMAGLILLAIGYLRLGVYIKYIPHPVTVGFTAGIAVIIFASQIKELFGLSLEKEPAELIHKLDALWKARDSLNPAALGVAAVSLAIILSLKAWRPRWPGMLIAVIAGGLGAWALGLPVETIGSRYGQAPSFLPAPRMPAFSFDLVQKMLPAAIAIALLGGIESLLSAVVADGMTGGRHRCNCELVAQGYANIVSALFGGLCATGTIARTATNVRAGAHGPVAGMLHAIFLLAILMVAAPLVSYIPLATLAAILAVVSWNMAEKAEFARLLRGDRAEALVLLVTFGLTIFRDLTEGIAAGVTLGALVFMHRMAETVDVSADGAFLGDDRPDTQGEERAPYEPDGRNVVVYRIAGPFFFGAAARVAQALKAIGRTPRAYVLDLSAAPMIDSTAAHELEGFIHDARKAGAQVFLAGAAHEVVKAMLRSGLDRHSVRLFRDVEAARQAAGALKASDPEDKPASGATHGAR